MRDDGDSAGERSEKWNTATHTVNIYLLDFPQIFRNNFFILLFFKLYLFNDAFIPAGEFVLNFFIIKASIIPNLSFINFNRTKFQ